MTSVRDAAFAMLRARGMTTIFGNPGSTELPMLADFPEDFRYVLGLQEAVAVGMADGYAQASGAAGARQPPHGARASATRWARSSTRRPTSRRCVVTAGQQARSLITLQANLTNRDADADAAPAREVELRAAARRGRPACARARRSTSPRCRRAGRCSSRSRWTTGAAEVDDGAVAHQTVARGHRPRGRRPASRARRSPRAWTRRSARSLVAGPGHRRERRVGRGGRAGRAQRLPVWATPAPGGGRIGFPEGHALFQGVLPPAVGPVGEALEGHDLVLVAGSSVFPYYPNIPGPLLPEGTELVAITERPRRGGAGADGRRDRRRRRR